MTKGEKMIRKQLLFMLVTSFILFGCGNDVPFGGTIDPNPSAQEVDEMDDKAYEEVYDSYEQVFDELIVEFNEEALDPDIFFAEYGISSVYEEKLEQMEIEGLKAQDALDDVLQNELGNEADWEVWTDKIKELSIQKVLELEEAHEVMLDY